MNNPEVNFMSPLKSQPMKKQRGGSTPNRSTGASSTSSRGAASSSSRVQVDAEDAIARRRAELRRLQQQRNNASSSSRARTRPEVTSTTELLGNTNSNKAKGGPPLAMAKQPSTQGGPPPTMLSQGGLERVSHSDLFPTVSKQPAAAQANHRYTGSNSKPPLAAMSNKPPKSTAPSSGNHSKPPPPPPVNRKLEFARAKSAPPARPPPPPPANKAGGPPKKVSKEAPSRVQRTSTTPASSRPAPVSAKSLLSPGIATTKSTSNDQGPPRGMMTGAPPKQPTEDAPPPIMKLMTNDPVVPTPKATTATTTAAADGPPPMFQSLHAPPSSMAEAPEPLSMAQTPGPNTNNKKQQTPALQKTPGIDSAPPTDVKTPAATQAASDTEHPSTARRDRIRSMRQHVDSPAKEGESAPSSSSFLKNETNARLEKAYKQAQEEKRDALKQVQALEEKLAQAASVSSASVTSPDPQALQQMLQVADQEGEEAALKWARQQLSSDVPPLANDRSTVGFSAINNSYMVPASPAGRMFMNPETPLRRRIQDRTVTPHPKQISSSEETDDPTAAQPSMVQLERQNISHYREAARCIPYEYNSDLATFTIRRPYGIETASKLFGFLSPTVGSQYARKAHVSTMSTLEVAVSIRADNSLLLLWDTAGVRYRTNPNGDWTTVDNVDELDRSLGTVSYIDAEANEKDYSLDQILEEALLVREQYCSTMASTALGFKERPPTIVAQAPVAVPAASEHIEKPKPATAEMGVDTSDIPYPPAEINVPTQQMEKPQPSTKNKTKEEPKKPKSAPKPVEPEEEAASGDVLAIFLGMILKSVAGTIWWLLVGLPVATFKTSVTLVFSLAILGMLYLFALEQHNGLAANIATTSYYTNAPGIL